jgi:ATP-dependent Clp protease ATP-binding subunit ClpX
MRWSSSTSGCSRWRDVQLTFTEEHLKRSPRRRSNARPVPVACARSWRGILLDTMFEPNLRGVEEVVISGEVVDGNAEPLYVHAKKSQPEAG